MARPVTRSPLITKRLGETEPGPECERQVASNGRQTSLIYSGELEVPLSSSGHDQANGA